MINLNLNLKKIKQCKTFESVLEELYNQGYIICEEKFNLKDVADGLIKSVVIKLEKNQAVALEISDYTLDKTGKYIIIVYDISDNKINKAKTLF